MLSDMARTPRADLNFTMKLAFRNALKLCRGIRRQVTDVEEDIAAKEIVAWLERSGYKFVHAPRDIYHGKDWKPVEIE